MSNKTENTKRTAEIAEELRKMNARLEALQAEAATLKAEATDEDREAYYARMEVERAANHMGYASRRIEKAASAKSDTEFANEALASAEGVLRQDYFDDVEEVADDFIAAWKAGEFEGDRSAAMQSLEETIDGSGRIIWTRQAQLALLFSDNAGAYFDNFGKDGAVKDGELQWSRLAYAAFREDVLEAISRKGINPNDDPPEEKEEAEAEVEAE